MTTQLRAMTECVQRSAARAVSPVGLRQLGTDTTPTFAWNAMPSVPSSAICTHGKYHARRLQEVPT